MISPGEMRTFRRELERLAEVARAIGVRDPKIREGYVQQVRAGLDVLVEQTKDLERRAWEDDA